MIGDEARGEALAEGDAAGALDREERVERRRHGERSAAAVLDADAAVGFALGVRRGVVVLTAVLPMRLCGGLVMPHRAEAHGDRRQAAQRHDDEQQHDGKGLDGAIHAEKS